MDYSNKAYQPGVKEKIVGMTVNGSGIRDIDRVLGISRNTVIETKKKNLSYTLPISEWLEQLENPSNTKVKLKKVLVAEVDDM